MSIVEETAVLIDVEEATPIDKAGPTGEEGAILTDGEGTTPTDETVQCLQIERKSKRQTMER